MKRAVTLGLLMLIGALSLALNAAQQPAGTQSMVVEVEKLKDNLFVLRGNGGGGNTAVFVQANGVTVVDTKNPGWGQPILDKIRELTPKPVTRIVNTHTHGDHTSGNVAFPASVEIVTHENTKKRMQEWRPYYGRTEPPRNVFKESGGKGMPTRTFKDRLSIGSGNDHHRPQHADDVGRSEGVHRFQSGVLERRACSQAGGKERGRCGGHLEDSAKVQRLYCASTRAVEGQRAGRLHRTGRRRQDKVAP